MAKASGQPNSIFRRRAIAAGVTAAIGSGSAGLAWSAELEEVVVTARQRAESSQDIPMMVQSLSGEEIQNKVSPRWKISPASWPA